MTFNGKGIERASWVISCHGMEQWAWSPAQDSKIDFVFIFCCRGFLNPRLLSQLVCSPDFQFFFPNQIRIFLGSYIHYRFPGPKKNLEALIYKRLGTSTTCSPLLLFEVWHASYLNIRANLIAGSLVRYRRLIPKSRQRYILQKPVWDLRFPATRGISFSMIL